MEMYVNIRKSVKVKSMKLKSFDIKVGVHQGSVLSPLVVVINEMKKDFRGVVKELIYADDKVLLRNSWKKVTSQYSHWKGQGSESEHNKQDEGFCQGWKNM